MAASYGRERVVLELVPPPVVKRRWMPRWLRWLRDRSDELFIGTAPTFYEAMFRADVIAAKRDKEGDE
jgi:hypothetical protein